MHKQHTFDDCKCCQQPEYCLTCGLTRNELEMQEEVRRLKAQMREREKDYRKTLSEITEVLANVWAQSGMMDSQKQEEIEKENEK